MRSRGKSGLRGPHDTHGPRLHDLRHRFATTTLVNWYRSKEDPQQRLPILSAFLGHVHVADTQWYLSASPELMREAMRRLEHRWAKGNHERYRQFLGIARGVLPATLNAAAPSEPSYNQLLPRYVLSTPKVYATAFTSCADPTEALSRLPRRWSANSWIIWKSTMASVFELVTCV